MAIYRDLVDGYGFTGVYQSVKHFQRKLRDTKSPEACVVIETARGEEPQVDYGVGPMVRDPWVHSRRPTRSHTDSVGQSAGHYRRDRTAYCKLLNGSLHAGIHSRIVL